MSASRTSSTPITYVEWRPGSTIGGDQALIFPALYSPQLENERAVLVYLPPSYYSGKRARFPVVYMQDGQNLLDPATSFAGVTWGLGSCMAQLATEGIEAIVVGIWNNDQRQHEYTPFGSRWAGTGAAYMQFVARTLKPLIDGTFRTLKNRSNTAIIGSSLGGLISTYAFFKNASTFGLMGALSPAYWPGNGAIYEHVKKLPGKPGRVYLDNGAGENSAQRMANFLITLKGYQLDHDLNYVQDPQGQHDEASWARRLPDALRFLLRRTKNPDYRTQLTDRTRN